jgi:hypothetical protein
MDKINTLPLYLAEKQEKITQSVTLHRGLLSALWLLPTKVLSQIFVHCLPQSDLISLENSLNSAPMLLTRICRRWRDVALDTPNLWCRLYMDIYYPHYRQWEQQRFFFDLWLKRSQGRPVEVELSGVGINSWVGSTLHDCLQPYSNQISSLLIRNEIEEPKPLLEGLPALQELTLPSINGNNEAKVAESISRLPSTLRSLRFSARYGFSFQELCSFNPIWTQLTNVMIGVRCAFTFICFLKLCPNLSSATIHIARGRNVARGHDVPLAPFTHVGLQSLSISCPAWATANPVADLFGALSLPNLRVFDACRLGTWPHGDFRAFLAQSNCHLERLTLGGGMTTDEQRAEYIALIPSLEVLVELQCD